MREIAEQERRAKEHEDEMKKDQKRKEIINRRDKAKKFGRRKKRNKPRGLPSKLEVGDCVLIKQGIGIVRYLGTIMESKKNDKVYAGIELKESHAKGLNDGSAFGRRYFQCEEKKGVFVRHVPKVLQPESLLLQLGKLNADLKQKKIDQVKLHNELANLRSVNEDLQRKFEAEKEKAKLVEIECFNQSDAEVPVLPIRLSNRSRSQSEDDEKLPTISDGKKFDQPFSVLHEDRASIRIQKANYPHQNFERKKKALFRVASGDCWTENDVMDYEKVLQKELEKGQREQALMALDLPDFNAPDGDLVKWLSQRFQQFTKLDSSFQVPDIKDVKVKRALLVVTRMLASFTQQINRKDASYRMMSTSLLSTVNSGDDEEDFSTSSEDSSEDDF